MPPAPQPPSSPSPAPETRPVWRRQFARFVAVGLCAVAAHYSAMAALMALAGWSATAASALGFAVGAVVSYGLNRRYTFESDRAHHAAAPRHALTVGSGWVLNTAGVALLQGPLGWPIWVAQVISTGGVLVWHFALSRWWVFRPG